MFRRHPLLVLVLLIPLLAVAVFRLMSTHADQSSNAGLQHQPARPQQPPPPLEAREAAPVQPPAAPAERQDPTLIAVAELLQSPPSFDPATSPYLSALVELKFKLSSMEQGQLPAPTFLVTTPLVIDRKRQPAASLTKGREYRMVLDKTIPQNVSTWQRVSTPGDAAILLDMYWCSEIKETP